ncbi:MAG: 23S rRNA (adenine(2030)-N(6))-methyltransferase RlmJ [Pseudomonadota bacterium]
MLSYLHGFHAGNFADVHKHITLTLVLEHLRRKDKPFCVIDTHAGSGWYDLHGDQARKTGEWQGGIAAVQNGNAAPEMVQHYLDIVAGFEPERRCPDMCDGKSDSLFYPGSPFLIREMLRPDDQLTLMELHPREYDLLAHRVRRDGRIHLHKRDGYEGLVALMPPAIRRGLVLMDPSYDVKQDYKTAAHSIQRAWEKWPTGIFMLWYPVLESGFDVELRSHFAQIPAAGGVLCAELSTDQGGAKGRMRGTGLLIVNPPYQLDTQLAQIGDWLAGVVKLPAPGRHRVDWLVPSA